MSILKANRIENLTTTDGGINVNNSGNVGIGNTNPARELSIGDGSGSPNIQFLASSAGNSRVEFGDSDDSDVGEIQYVHSSNYMQLTTNGSERLRIDSSGRLLIGTTTEGDVNADDLTIANSGNCGMTIRSGASSFGGIFFSDGTSGDAEYQGQILYDHNSSYMRFQTGATERMRIDSSGNVLVGKTTTALTTVGTRIASGSITSSDSSSSTNLGTNSGGSISLANTDSTDNNFSNIGGYNSNGLVVNQINFINTSHSSRTGEIGFSTHNGSSLTERMRIDSSGDLRLEEALRYQYNTASTDSRTWYIRNDIHAYGDLAFRRSTTQTGATFETKILFKDTGGICFNGDTAAANALNDYEEGTFTPVFQTTGTAFSSVTYTNQIGNYTKIGNLVHVSIRLRSSASSGGSGFLLIGGLPFQVDDETGAGGGSPATYYIDYHNSTLNVATEIRDNTSQFYLLSSTDNGDWSNVSAGGIQGVGTSEVRVSFAYQTDS